ncbi:MBL fold metallo-hydrolase [Ectothiorhodospiraceae bacterium 2226]|nr:MBL fold metallo-hydrolase [Ectothiorhodospiraceae bacterium 2226]
MLFRQLLEPDSSTYTYLLSCTETGATALIDPVLDTVDRDLKVLDELGLKLSYTIDTHIHADHLTGAHRLRERTGCKVVYPAIEKPDCADIGLEDGQEFRIGNIPLHALHTPGHTAHHFMYLVDTGTHKMLFSGDTLLIEACGRTDFQSGDAEALYRSIHEKVFSLPDETLIYPGHDYEGRFVTTVAQEKARNPRLGQGKSLEEFVAIMDGLDLPYPRKIDFAVPGNQRCGICPPNVPEEYRAPCEQHDQG